VLPLRILQPVAFEVPAGTKAPIAALAAELSNSYRSGNPNRHPQFYPVRASTARSIKFSVLGTIPRTKGGTEKENHTGRRASCGPRGVRAWWGSVGGGGGRHICHTLLLPPAEFLQENNAPAKEYTLDSHAREPYRKNIQQINIVAAKSLLRQPLVQNLRSSRNTRHIHSLRASAAQPLEFLLLQKTRTSSVQLQREYSTSSRNNVQRSGGQLKATILRDRSVTAPRFMANNSGFHAI